MFKDQSTIEKIAMYLIGAILAIAVVFHDVLF
jgi:hypothetical protein